MASQPHKKKRRLDDPNGLRAEIVEKMTNMEATVQANEVKSDQATKECDDFWYGHTDNGDPYSLMSMMGLKN